MQFVALFEGERIDFNLMPCACAHPAIFGDNHSHRLINHRHADTGFLRFFEQGAAFVTEFFCVCFDFFDELTFENGFVVEQFLQAHEFIAQVHQFLLDFNRLQPRQLTQANF